MMFRTHLAVSLIIGMTILPSSKLNIFIFLLGALFPDIDTTTSFIGKRIKIIGWLFQHRGFFHSFTAMFILSFMIYVFSATTGIAFAVGYGSHLLLDMLNHAGIRVFYPLPFKIKGFLKTGGIGETTIFITSLIGAFILILR